MFQNQLIFIKPNHIFRSKNHKVSHKSKSNPKIHIIPTFTRQTRLSHENPAFQFPHPLPLPLPLPSP